MSDFIEIRISFSCSYCGAASDLDLEREDEGEVRVGPCRECAGNRIAALVEFEEVFGKDWTEDLRLEFKRVKLEMAP